MDNLIQVKYTESSEEIDPHKDGSTKRQNGRDRMRDKYLPLVSRPMGRPTHSFQIKSSFINPTRGLLLADRLVIGGIQPS